MDLHKQKNILTAAMYQKLFFQWGISDGGGKSLLHGIHEIHCTGRDI